MVISEEAFEKLVANAIDLIPEQYQRIHENVVFEIADMPTTEQRVRAKLRANDMLYGLFEGVPDADRSSRATTLLPAKITIFRHPMVDIHTDESSLQKQVTQTVWHEVAHYFGLNHDAMHRIQNKHR